MDLTRAGRCEFQGNPIKDTDSRNSRGINRNQPISAAEVTLDDSKFGVKNERERGVTIVDTAIKI
ncbi:hypothetical protein [Chamaesiphon sp. VAR_48_metabat_403]|uniref:hypothetical protein n=1 Tax=Chamaesiphon sp. VAR_48_metabat_403 TaxID=2964700 RepID=UPI00286E6FE4|nr:hypothetical protein [Chamaesiphon sp. VAR_48_metabat_403]